MRVLVTGGAGYIGSHMAKLLVETGAEVTVLDDLSTGHAEAARNANFVRGDIADIAATRDLLQKAGIEAVVHFAASSLVGESMADPLKYYRRNVGGTAALVQAMREAKVTRIVFSSTAAVYGDPVRIPIDEAHPTQPVNPYGASKLAVERMLSECNTAYGIGAVVLRYFNAAGADPSGEIGERHDPETHLIPLVLQAAAGRRKSISVFGNDWPTRDGTCVRDYIHVEDLAAAHLLALDAAEPGRHKVYNLGNGNGFSNRQVVDVVRAVTAAPVPVQAAPRRPGDPAQLVASSARARTELGWVPAKPDLHDIVADAWTFARTRDAST
jgi:UDP-glucose 4-epimerase